jgi:hypothetical protein
MNKKEIGQGGSEVNSYEQAVHLRREQAAGVSASYD